MSSDNPQDKKKENTKYDEHTKKYTDLLDSFITNTKSSNKLKSGLKIAFFIIIVLIMVGLAALFSYSVYKAFNVIMYLNTENNHSTESVIGTVASIIPSLATMIVALIKLPKIIAKYLFNPEEDKNMVAIIEKIQNYDIQMYSLENDIEHLLMKSQKKSTTNDKPIEELSEMKEPSSETNNNQNDNNNTNNNPPAPKGSTG